MAFRIVFPEYFIDIIVIICQILFVIACRTSYVNYYRIRTVALFSVNSPNMFTIQIVMHVFVLVRQSWRSTVTRMSASILWCFLSNCKLYVSLEVLKSSWVITALFQMGSFKCCRAVNWWCWMLDRRTASLLTNAGLHTDWQERLKWASGLPEYKLQVSSTREMPLMLSLHLEP